MKRMGKYCKAYEIEKLTEFAAGLRTSKTQKHRRARTGKSQTNQPLEVSIIYRKTSRYQ